MKKILFICSRNRIRSLTAEHIFAKAPGLQVRSAGTENDARVRVTAGHIGWADLVVVVCLDIPDDFEYMDEELVATLSTRMLPYVDEEPVPKPTQ
jgi:predicted protein tyrosine phosphatase